MSQIYLTKIERKTIFTKSLIFVLIMFIISDLTVTGPFYFNFIPWMYILGIAGSVKKIDSVLMSVIGTFTVFVASLITQGGFAWSCMITTLITLLMLVLGIITGKIIYEFILEHRLVKYIKPSKKTIYIISIVAMVIVAFVTVGTYNGNVVTYLKSRGNLEEYIYQTYGIEEFETLSTKFNRKVKGKYVYEVKLEGQDVYFVPVTKEVFKDVNVSQRLEKLNSNLHKETDKMLNNIKTNYELLTNMEAMYNLKYTNFGVNPDTIVLNISCICDDEELGQLYHEISEYIQETLTNKSANLIVITINNESLEILEKDIQYITADYIKGGFEIEEIID